MNARNGLNYHAPDWFTRDLPPLPLDCELFAGYGKRDTLAGATTWRDPNRWRSLKARTTLGAVPMKFAGAAAKDSFAGSRRRGITEEGLFACLN